MLDGSRSSMGLSKEENLNVYQNKAKISVDNFQIESKKRKTRNRESYLKKKSKSKNFDNTTEKRKKIAFEVRHHLKQRKKDLFGKKG